MSKTTERLLQVAAIIFFLWFGWDLVSKTVVKMLVMGNQLRACQQQLKAKDG